MLTRNCLVRGISELNSSFDKMLLGLIKPKYRNIHPSHLLTEPYILPYQKTSEIELEKLLKDNDIVFRGASNYFSSFDSLNLPDVLSKIVNEKYPNPTVLQQLALPVGLSGQDLVGVSKAGNGRKLSYILPMVVHILNRFHTEEDPDSLPMGLIITHSKEQVDNIKQETLPYFVATGLFNCTITPGATNRSFQIINLKKKPHVLICTPGRLLNLLDTKETSLTNVTSLVFDNAESLFSVSLEPVIRTILTKFPHKPQTTMWCSSWMTSMDEFVEDYMKTSAYLQVKSGSVKVSTDIDHVILHTSVLEKYKLLLAWTNKIKAQQGKALIFIKTRRTADEVCRRLLEDGIECVTLHNSIETGVNFIQSFNQMATNFSNGMTRFIIMTEETNKRINVNDISHVINYDMPKTIEQFLYKISQVHRGHSVNFLTDNETKIANELINILKPTGKHIPPFVFNIAKRSQSHRP